MLNQFTELIMLKIVRRQHLRWVGGGGFYAYQQFLRRPREGGKKMRRGGLYTVLPTLHQQKRLLLPGRHIATNEAETLVLIRIDCLEQLSSKYTPC